MHHRLIKAHQANRNRGITVLMERRIIVDIPWMIARLIKCILLKLLAIHTMGGRVCSHHLLTLTSQRHKHSVNIQVVCLEVFPNLILVNSILATLAKAVHQIIAEGQRQVKPLTPILLLKEHSHSHNNIILTKALVALLIKVKDLIRGTMRHLLDTDQVG